MPLNKTLLATAMACIATQQFGPKAGSPAKPLKRCAAGRDGECFHVQCPQLHDDEPRATGRHCPLDNHSED